jgi:UDP-N-acetylmuramyl tripeptide synthase
VFNSPSSLDYIQGTLEKTFLSSTDQRLDRLPFQGLPVVVVLAHNPDVTEKGLMHLRDQGQILADR